MPNTLFQRSLPMSALSVFKPVDRVEPAAKKLSAADLLAGAAKKSKASSHLAYADKAGQEVAAHWLELNAKLAETERDLGLARDQLLDVIRPWHEEACVRRRAHEATVVVDSPAGAVRVSFQH